MIGLHREWGNIGIMEKKWKPLQMVLLRDNGVIQGHNRFIWGIIGILEKSMETTIQGLGSF